MGSNLYHSVPGPAGSSSQGYLIIWWADAQEQKAPGKIQKSGRILISVGWKRNLFPASIWRHKGQGKLFEEGDLARGWSGEGLCHMNWCSSGNLSSRNRNQLTGWKGHSGPDSE